MSEIKVYGISSCDTVRKGKQFLDDNGVEYEYQHFHKVEGLSTHIHSWFKKAGKEEVLNIKSRNYKQLDSNLQSDMWSNDSLAAQEMEKLPQLIKRPVAVKGDLVLTGFNKEEWEQLL